MSPLGAARRLLASLRRRRAEEELDEEIRFHLAMEAEENRRRGMDPDEARRAAERAFGRRIHAVDGAHAARGLPWLEDAASDARLALRTIRRSPGFSLAVVLLMALGIGANAAVYTVVDGVLLRPLPYPEADELLALQRTTPRMALDVQDGNTVEALRRERDPAQAVAAYGGFAGLNLVDGDVSFHVQALPVSHEYIDVLGLELARGRRFSAADEVAGAAPVAIVGPELARRLGAGRTDLAGTVSANDRPSVGDVASAGRSDGSPLGDDVVGRRVQLGGVPHEIVGVLAGGASIMPSAQLLVPIRFGVEAGGTNYRVLARAQDGPGAAATRLAASEAGLRRAGQLQDQVHLRWIGLQRSMSAERRPILLLLLGAVGLVLLIACANIAGLLLIRAQRRSAELAVRAALGAGPGRLVRQLLVEGMVYALVGGALGLAAAHGALAALLRLAPPDLAEWRVGIDGRVALFALALTALTGLACGALPALRASRVDLRRAVGGGASGVAASAARSGWRRNLLVAQLALCTLLLLGAALLARTLLSLRAVDLGFQPGSLLALTMAPEDSAALPLQAFYARALERAAETPGVRAVALAGAVPGRRGLNMPMTVSGRAEPFSAGWRYVSPGYFELLQIPIERGRGLRDGDAGFTQPVAVVNRAFVRAFLPAGADPIGHQLEVMKLPDVPSDPRRTIVGVVGDTRDEGPRVDPEPRVYVAAAQVPPALFGMLHRWFDACWLVATDLPPAEAADRLGAVFHALQPSAPFSEVARLDAVVEEHVAAERFVSWLLGAFALVAVVIAVAGIYGLTAYSISQRSREIAIRMALGAPPARILRNILGEGLVVAGLGILLGLLASWPLAPVLQRFLYGATSFEPATAAGVAALLLGAVAAACVMPAVRAARIDPVRNLRQG